MVVIFAFSGQSGSQSNRLSNKVEMKVENMVPKTKAIIGATEKQKVNAVRKLAHLCLFAGLGLLSIFLFKVFNVKKQILSAGFFCFIYACIDEFHQIYIPGREGKVTDVAIDLIGAAAGMILALLITLAYSAKNNWVNLRGTK